MKCESQDLIQENVEKLAQLFPCAITEIKGSDGMTRKAVNFKVLQMLFSYDAANAPEQYAFTWPGKSEAIQEAHRPVRKTLRPCPEESRNWDTTENLYLEGDNLDILKLLRENYLGKVKMIYIDPPYNTGNSFIYCDNYFSNKKSHKTMAEEIERDKESNGRFHSNWCSMIYPRLMLARDMLAEDGLCFLSCDDNELENLKKICSEIFGENNFITNFAVENNPKGRKNNAFVAASYEYCLLYAKNIKFIYEYLRKNNKKKFLNFLANDNDKRKSFFDEHGEYKQSKRQVCGINKSSRLASASRPERCFTIYHNDNLNSIRLLDEYDKEKDAYQISHVGKQLVENGYKRYVAINSLFNRPAIPLYSKDTIHELFDNNYLLFKDDGSIYEKDRGSSRQVNSFISNKKYSLDLMTESATAQMAELMGVKNIFPNSKSLDFIKTLVFLYPAKDFICLDFFSGSATTAHAVMQLNAEDGGRRKFIMVQLPVECAPDTQAAKSGYKNICEIGKERIRRAGEKIKNDNAHKAGIGTLDIGFRVLKCDSGNMEDQYYSSPQTAQDSLLGNENTIKKDRTDLDLLFGCIVELGLPLSLSHKIEYICGHKIHFYNGLDLACCFDANIGEQAIEQLAKLKPLRAVLHGSAFAGSHDKINAINLFIKFSPDTLIKVL